MTGQAAHVLIMVLEDFLGADECVDAGGFWNGTDCDTPDFRILQMLNVGLQTIMWICAVIFLVVNSVRQEIFQPLVVSVKVLR